MMRIPLAVVVTLLLASRAAAQGDVIIFKDPAREGGRKECRIVSLNFKEVSYSDRRGIPNKVESKAVLELQADPNKKTFDFAQADTAMNGGDFAKAIPRYQNVLRDPRANPLLRQLAAINAVKCYWQLGNASAALGAIQALRQSAPSSFYLRESYEYEVRCHLARNDAPSAQRAVDAFSARGTTEGMKEWKKAADVMRAGLLEKQGKWQAALSLHSKYARDKEVGVDATLGEFRCLTELKKWSALSGRASAVISLQKNSKRKNYQLLTAAHNAKGEMSLNSKKYREALLSFMLGVSVFSKGTGSSNEHEASLARATVACALYAGQQADKAKKDTYRSRAMELLSELNRKYPGSPKRVEPEILLKNLK